MINNKGGINPVAAAVAGAVVGAGVAVAGAAVLSNKKNREKIGKALNNVKDQAVGYVEGVKKQAEDKKNEIKKEFVKGKKIAQKTVKDAKKVIHLK